MYSDVLNYDPDKCPASAVISVSPHEKASNNQ